jgi:hypothetical protein
MKDRGGGRIGDWMRLAEVEDEKERIYRMVNRFEQIAGESEDVRREEVRSMLEAMQRLSGDELVNYVKSVLRAWARMETPIAQRVTEVYEDLRSDLRPNVEGAVPLEQAAFPDLSPPQRSRLAALLPSVATTVDRNMLQNGVANAEAGSGG